MLKVVNRDFVYTSSESTVPIRTSDDGLEVRLGALARVQGDVKITVSNSWGKVCSFWFNTAFLQDQRMGHMLFWKKGLDGPFKDKKHKLFPANFSGSVREWSCGPSPSRSLVVCMAIVGESDVGHVFNSTPCRYFRSTSLLKWHRDVLCSFRHRHCACCDCAPVTVLPQWA